MEHDGRIRITGGAPAPRPDEPGLQPGDRVSWSSRNAPSRQGRVFWVGPSKHGPGIRVGVRDDGDNTLWFDARRLTLVSSALPLPDTPQRVTRAHRSLVQPLVTAPDDWESWLVYADWLAENHPDDTRREMIVLAHRLATEPLGKAESRRIERRIFELEGEKRWRKHIEHWEALDKVTFQHGFVRRATFWGNRAGAAFVELWNADEAWLLEEAVFEPFQPQDMLLLARSEALDAFSPGSTALAAAAATWITPGRRFEWPRERREQARFVVRRGARG